MASQLTRRTALSVEHELTKSGGPRGRTHHDQRKAPGRRGVRTPSNREKPSDTALSLSLHLSLSPLAKATVASKEERAELCASSSPSPFFRLLFRCSVRRRRISTRRGRGEIGISRTRIAFNNALNAVEHPPSPPSITRL